MGQLAWALLGCVLTSCGDDGGRFEAQIGSPIEAEIETLVEGPVSFAQALPDYGAIARSESLFRLDPVSAAMTDYGAGAGEVVSAADVSGEALVVSGTEGLFAVQGRTLVPSPLGEIVPSDPPPVLFAAPGPQGDDLWIATDESMLLWRDGVVYDPEMGGLPTDSARFTYGSAATERGDPAVWVATPNRAYGLAGSSSLRAYKDDHDVSPTGIGADARGLLWLASDGEIHRRHEDGTWDWTSLSSDVVTLGASYRRRDVWIETEDGLWHADGDRFVEVSNAPEGSLAGVDPAGRALVSGDDGLFRLAAGRILLLSGLEDGSSLVGYAIVSIVATSMDGLEEISATVDEEPVEVSGQPWHVTLDPVELEDGAHHLDVAATYEGAREPVTASLYFSVGEFEPATWSQDVEPIFVDNCKKCHGADGGAHRLDSRARWESDIETILDMTTSQRMPLPPNPPLSDEEIQLIQSWRAGGFPE